MTLGVPEEFFWFLHLSRDGSILFRTKTPLREWNAETDQFQQVQKSEIKSFLVNYVTRRVVSHAIQWLNKTLIEKGRENVIENGGKILWNLFHKWASPKCTRDFLGWM